MSRRARTCCLAALAGCLAGPAQGQEPKATHRYELYPDGRGSVRVEATIDPDLARAARAATKAHYGVAAWYLSAWTGVTAWSDVTSKTVIAGGKHIDTVRAVGWFRDLNWLRPPAGYPLRYRKRGGSLELVQECPYQASPKLTTTFIGLKLRTLKSLRLIMRSSSERNTAPFRQRIQLALSGKTSQLRGFAKQPDETLLLVHAKRDVVATEVRFLDLLVEMQPKVQAKTLTGNQAWAEIAKRLGSKLPALRWTPSADDAAKAAFLAKDRAARTAWWKSPWKKWVGEAARARLRAKAKPKRAPKPQPKLDPKRFEPNDAFAQATRLQAGRFAGLRLYKEDWYRIESPRWSSLRISVSFFSRLGDIDISLHDASGKLLRSANGRGGLERLAHDPLGKPTWLRVYQADRKWSRYATPRYTLEVEHVPYVKRDALEPNEPPHRPRRIAVGSHTNLVCDGLDVYEIAGVQPGSKHHRQLTVQVVFDKKKVDLDLELREAGGGPLLAASRGSSGKETASCVEPPGGLEVRVTGEGAYRLVVTAKAAHRMDLYEPNDRAKQAKRIRPGTHTSLFLNGEDWYWIAVPAKRTLQVVATPTGESPPDLDLELRDAKGRVLRRANSLRSKRERLTWHHTGAGLEQVLLRVFAPGSTAYTLEIGARPYRPADAFEPNDRRSEARALSAGKHTALVCTGEDWYRIELKPGQRVVAEIAFDHAKGGDLDLELYRGPKLLIGSHGLSDRESVRWVAKAAGTHFLRVNGRNRYRLTLSLPK